MRPILLFAIISYQLLFLFVIFRNNLGIWQKMPIEAKLDETFKVKISSTSAHSSGFAQSELWNKITFGTKATSIAESKLIDTDFHDSATTISSKIASTKTSSLKSNLLESA